MPFFHARNNENQFSIEIGIFKRKKCHTKFLGTLVKCQAPAISLKLSLTAQREGIEGLDTLHALSLPIVVLYSGPHLGQREGALKKQSGCRTNAWYSEGCARVLIAI
jgi:hypothetical protein